MVILFDNPQNSICYRERINPYLDFSPLGPEPHQLKPSGNAQDSTEYRAVNLRYRRAEWFITKALEGLVTLKGMHFLL